MMCETTILQRLNNYVKSQSGAVVGLNYQLVPPFMQFGEGDMLCDVNGMLVAIECKFMGKVHGKTARTRRNKHRKKVIEQTILHASFVKLRHPSRRVRGAAVTDEKAVIVCDNISIEEAGRNVLQRINRVDSGLVPCVSLGALSQLFVSLPTCLLNEC